MTPNVRLIPALATVLVASGLVCVGLTAIQGCSTTATTTAFNASTATDAAVRTAMTGWGLYVAAEHPSSNSEQQVWMAFESVKAGEVAVLQAESQLATNSSATNLLVTAENALGASISGLTNVINALTNTPAP